MTAQQVLDALNRANPVCVLCHGASLHPAIVGDGPPRCFPCIAKLVHLSTEPSRPPETDVNRITWQRPETPPWSVGP